MAPCFVHDNMQLHLQQAGQPDEAEAWLHRAGALGTPPSGEAHQINLTIFARICCDWLGKCSCLEDPMSDNLVFPHNNHAIPGLTLDSVAMGATSA